ncbi:HipA family kinase [Pedobacter glucosidilyticus]|uniref:HipA family kinase n=1 Tax=Pedobacter glucosidilyticus TaxID=1122941 RepID=UPI0003FD2E36|nr:HipA family kinase [Pedobacter glucosidilyticus]
MIKLSHPDYFLPVVHALEPGKIFDTGTTAPQLVRGVCEQTGTKSDYVVKYIKGQRMSAEASCRELLAAYIAAELEFNVPEPALINISSDFTELLRGSDNYQTAVNSIGFNFGNKYEEGYQQIMVGQHIDDKLNAKLVELLAFDIFIGNADRRLDKPNFMSNGDDILIFDHELAFGFTLELPFLRNPKPWIIRDSDMEWIKNNFCFVRLKGRDLKMDNFINKLSAINDDFWVKYQNIAPAEWLTDQVKDIKEYLQKLIDKSDIFESEIKRILL